MTRWRVHATSAGVLSHKPSTFDGHGSTDLSEEYTDKPTALRRAQELVERGPYATASVQPMRLDVAVTRHGQVIARFPDAEEAARYINALPSREGLRLQESVPLSDVFISDGIPDDVTRRFPVATRILITIKDGCLASVCADGELIVELMDMDTLDGSEGVDTADENIAAWIEAGWLKREKDGYLAPRIPEGMTEVYSG